jgi:NAD(P)H-hydrate repair Nnr-like enzyme with NAD(P)H-hydrate epimerase domain
MFSESINQSIISDSGSNYQSRILSVLNKNGIKNVSKIHDKDDKSTEYDFFFDIYGKTYGIGAKRTLREGYKQFIKTAHTSKIDVSIEVTIGLDLNEEKAKTIIGHDTYIFVADEVYNSRNYLKNMEKVYSAKDLTLETLKKLS